MPKDITPGTVTLVGSGELSPAMSRVHRAVMSRIAGPVRAVFVDTPAGFELNADQISAKAVDYFARRLDTQLQVVSFKSAACATPAQIEAALNRLHAANYILAGPGSPTYAVRHWRDTVILEAIARRLAQGAHLVLASAAAIAIGRYALPVYEIYKVGERLHWVDGLDLLGPYGLEPAIVPHWNNRSGQSHDTRYCFMGAPRLKRLEQLLPDSAVIWGIDENTALTLDLSAGRARLMGAGGLTVRHAGDETRHPAEVTLSLDQLGPVAPDGGESALRAPVAHKVTVGELPPRWGLERDETDEEPGRTKARPFVELLVAVRDRLRADEQWTLADEIREQLSALGVTLEDGPEETTWRWD